MPTVTFSAFEVAFSAFTIAASFSRSSPRYRDLLADMAPRRRPEGPARPPEEALPCPTPSIPASKRH